MAIRFPFNPEKFRAALQYLAAKNLPEFDKYKVCKLLFLADKRHLVRHGRPITGDLYKALPHGPAPTTALDLLNAAIDGSQPIAGIGFDTRYQYPRILAANVEDQFLAASEREILDETGAKFGAMDFAELRALTHALPEYERGWARRAGSAGVMDFEDFFEEDPEAIAGAREAMLEDCALRGWLQPAHG